jgi:two-component system, OmpR family, sensor histidine kinase BaeS
MSRNSLLWKLTLAFMIVALIAAALLAVFIRSTNINRLNELVIEQVRSDLKTSLADYYELNGSWTGVAQAWTSFRPGRSLTPIATLTGRNQNGFTEPGPPGGGHDRRSIFGLADSSGVVVVGIDPFFHAGDQLSHTQLNQGDDVLVNGKRVGTILTAPIQPRLNPEETLFLQRTNQALLYAALGAILVALVVGILLALTLIRPLQALTQAAQKITQGDLEQQVKVTSKDEIGQLAQAFNQMSAEVSRVNRLRQQMTADIAHDLRTPLTVIAGYIESMQDGILAPTPERLALIYEEIQRLQNLVNDLRTLSLADAGELKLNPQPINPRSLLDRAAALYQHQAEQRQVTLRVDSRYDLPSIPVDESRMTQVFSNFISNSLRYTPPGGEIVLTADHSDDCVELCVRDTGSGIAPEDLPHIFERFYRADKSRTMEHGETGLGLAIARALVEAHGGTICAKSDSGQGTLICLQFHACEEPVAVE